MSAFEALKNISNLFEEDLRRSSNIYSSYEKEFRDNVAKKIKDISMFASKWRLLEAKTSKKSFGDALNANGVKDFETTMKHYGDTVSSKIIEQLTVKRVLQCHAMSALNKEINSSHDLELKRKIFNQLEKFRFKTVEISRLDSIIQEKEDALTNLREQWDMNLTELHKLRQNNLQQMEENYMDSPLYGKLQELIEKMEYTRLLINKMIMARNSNYDWLSDPDRRLNALKLARRPNTLSDFTTS